MFVLYYVSVVVLMVCEGVWFVLDFCCFVLVYLIVCYKLLLVDLFVLVLCDDELVVFDVLLCGLLVVFDMVFDLLLEVE